MGAPTSTELGTPAGANLKDGYPTGIAFSVNANVSFWEKAVTPPGADGGDTVDTTTMRNVKYRTFASRGLITLTEMTSTVAYDPRVYDDTDGFDALINVEGSITVHFSDGSKVDFFGYLRSFAANEIVEGTQPEGTIVIQPTNFDPVGKVEADPVYTAAA